MRKLLFSEAVSRGRALSCAVPPQTATAASRAAASCGSTCAATRRRRWWPVPPVEGCLPTTPSFSTTSAARAPWTVSPGGREGLGGSWAGGFGLLELPGPCEPRAGCAWNSLASLLTRGSHRIPELFRLEKISETESSLWLILTLSASHVLTRGRGSPASLGSLFQHVITLSMKKFLLLSHLNLPWPNLRLCPAGSDRGRVGGCSSCGDPGLLTGVSSPL